jgi:hypothetical protein
MASIIIFSTPGGLVLHEGRGSSRRTMSLALLRLSLLVASTMIVGCANYLGANAAAH